MKLKLLRKHSFITNNQTQAYKDYQANLNPGEVLVHGDFAQNYSFSVQNAIQSYHWSSGTCTIHPFVCYYKDENNKVKHINFVCISENKSHDTIAVHLFQTRLIRYLKTKIENLSKVIYFSDGCAGQYKNRKNFINLCYHETDFDGIRAEWHFFCHLPW